jgi:hypothetical protein
MQSLRSGVYRQLLKKAKNLSGMPFKSSANVHGSFWAFCFGGRVAIVVWVPAVLPDEHFLCLDMVCVSWSSSSLNAYSECAIVMEIWRSGAILQTDAAIPHDAIVTLATPNGPIQCKVSDCTQDEYGFLVEVNLNPSERWFPDSYRPVHLMAK